MEEGVDQKGCMYNVITYEGADMCGYVNATYRLRIFALCTV